MTNFTNPYKKGVIIIIRKKPYALQYLEALSRRVPEDYKLTKELMNELRNRESGYIGEKNMDFYVARLPFQHTYLIDLYLPSLGLTQIDGLLIFEQFILVLESKHISGVVSYNPSTRHLIREYANQVTHFSDPIAQAEFAAVQVQKMLSKVTDKEIVVEHLALLTSKHCVVTSELPENICRVEHLYQKVMSYLVKHKDKLILNESEIKASLLQLNRPFENNLSNAFPIDPQNLRKGIICPLCKKIVKQIPYKIYQCNSCDNSEDNLFLLAIKDYALLIDKQPINLHLRQFLQIPCRSKFRRTLQKYNVPKTGHSHATRVNLTQLLKL
ncbi:nuclease-related domain-containing protein [Mangrovibacillus cuniculi]|uniref:NERD domain-containing protein n=1 Tax=Mangrovibacillus cuniculi TaxID=2593652 RepID=A0A7S8CBZ5_9BACI|nr:nuclease-related domain-containing protein [Mangrovibacillus cuniculi]QPC47184.1 NERD domain-containing protein [Mangrovibacillus cuniculi]